MEESPDTKRWPTVYVETTVLSYLAAGPSSDLVTRGHQKSTCRWWRNRARWDLWISSNVMIEIIKGEHAMAVRRMELLAGLSAAPITQQARELASKLLDRGPLPAKARVDAEHIAAAAVMRMDYLVTWNLKHIANPAIRKRIEAICQAGGFRPPVICTPEELLES